MSLASGLVVGGRLRTRPGLPATVVVPEKAAATKARTGTTRAAVVWRGVAWAALLVVASAIGSTAVALVMIPAAAIASISAVKAMRDLRDPFSLAVAVLGPVVAAVSFIVADAQGANLGLTLALLVCMYDAACYLNGHGRGAGGWVGIGAGLVTVAVLAVLVAAVLVPPFTGFRPWLVVGLAGLAAPAGVALATSVPGWGRLPALRRLDSMFIAAPVWAILVALFVR